MDSEPVNPKVSIWENLSLEQTYIAERPACLLDFALIKVLHVPAEFATERVALPPCKFEIDSLPLHDFPMQNNSNLFFSIWTPKKLDHYF